MEKLAQLSCRGSIYFDALNTFSGRRPHFIGLREASHTVAVIAQTSYKSFSTINNQSNPPEFQTKSGLLPSLNTLKKRQHKLQALLFADPRKTAQFGKDGAHDCRQVRGKLRPHLL